MRVACHFEGTSPRSRRIAEAMAAGIMRCGDQATIMPPRVQPGVDVGIAYGWAYPEIFRNYLAQGRAFIHVDLGWWLRKPEPHVLEGFHKVVLNGRDPDPATWRVGGPERFGRLGLKIDPWRAGGNQVVIAGLSAKSAATRGLAPLEWEKRTIQKLRQLTTRPIVYRPKPSWRDARPIPGIGFSGPDEPIERALAGAHLLVTLHSNAAVDALLAGVPVSVEQGPCVNFSTPLNELEKPRRPDGREELMQALAWQQFSVPEMRSGECWRHFREQVRDRICLSQEAMSARSSIAAL